MKSTNPIAVALLTLALTLAAGFTPARAAIVVVAPTASTAGSFTITTDITFTITAAGSAQSFTFDEWVTSDGSDTYSIFSPNLSLSIDGGSPASFGLANFGDNNSYELNSISTNDGYIYLDNPFAVSIGNAVTLKAGTYSVGAIADFNPQTNQTFTGNMIITDGIGNPLSNFVTVPEPSTCITLLGGAAALLGARRRCVPAQMT